MFRRGKLIIFDLRTPPLRCPGGGDGVEGSRAAFTHLQVTLVTLERVVDLTAELAAM